VFVSFTNRYQNNALLNAKGTQQIQRMPMPPPPPTTQKMGAALPPSQKWETQNFQAINMGMKQIWQSEIIG
jgi:hypothetical protein